MQAIHDQAADDGDDHTQREYSQRSVRLTGKQQKHCITHSGNQGRDNSTETQVTARILCDGNDGTTATGKGAQQRRDGNLPVFVLT